MENKLSHGATISEGLSGLTEQTKQVSMTPDEIVIIKQGVFGLLEALNGKGRVNVENLNSLKADLKIGTEALDSGFNRHDFTNTEIRKVLYEFNVNALKWIENNQRMMAVDAIVFGDVSVRSILNPDIKTCPGKITLVNNGKEAFFNNLGQNAFDSVMSVSNSSIATKLDGKVMLEDIITWNNIKWEENKFSIIDKEQCRVATEVLNQQFSGEIVAFGEGILVLKVNDGEFRFFGKKGEILKSKDGKDILESRYDLCDITKAKTFLGLTEETGK